MRSLQAIGRSILLGSLLPLLTVHPSSAQERADTLEILATVLPQAFAAAGIDGPGERLVLGPERASSAELLIESDLVVRRDNIPVCGADESERLAFHVMDPVFT